MKDGQFNEAVIEFCTALQICPSFVPAVPPLRETGASPFRETGVSPFVVLSNGMVLAADRRLGYGGEGSGLLAHDEA
jgi:hypothetical protein